MRDYRDLVEFYTEKGMIASIRSSIVPPKGSCINIRKETYRVTGVSYCVDHVDEFHETCVRANVDVRKADPKTFKMVKP